MSTSNEFSLTSDQNSGVRTIMQFLDDPEARMMVVEGYAGTGKTTMIQHAIAELGGAFRVAFTAPTNKATKVLRHMAAEAGVSIDHVATIYSLLGLRLTPDGEMKTIARGGMGSKMGEFDIVVIDEGSMVNKLLMSHIEIELMHVNTKIIFMGDPLQLPPINEELSECFTKCQYRVVLTEVVRQAKDNPIIGITQSLRESITAGHWTFEFKSAKSPDGHGVYVMGKKQWEQWMRAGFASPAYKTDGDAFRAVAWRNVTVDYLNDRIRQAIYQEEARNRYLVGEHVLNAAPILDEFGEDILVPTDSEGIIRDIDIVDHPYHVADRTGNFKVYHLSIGYEEAGLVDAFVVHGDAERAVNRKLDQLSSEAKKDRRLWRSFWAFKETFSDIRPSHAITAHRSQGSTYENVFVDVGDIMRNSRWEEALKCLYVACSRASQNLMVLI